MSKHILSNVTDVDSRWEVKFKDDPNGEKTYLFIGKVSFTWDRQTLMIRSDENNYIFLLRDIESLVRLNEEYQLLNDNHNDPIKPVIVDEFIFEGSN